MKMIALALLATVVAAPAMAADPAPADQHYAKPKKPHMICKRDQDTATRMSKAICKTAEQWAENMGDGDAQLSTINREATTHDTGATLSRDRPH